MLIEAETNLVDVLARLRAQAVARQMSLDVYLRQFVEGDAALNGHVSLEEFVAALDELAAGPLNSPPLPADFSRADIYADHN